MERFNCEKMSLEGRGVGEQGVKKLTALIFFIFLIFEINFKFEKNFTVSFLS